MKTIYILTLAFIFCLGSITLSAQHTKERPDNLENQIQHNQPAPDNRHHERKITKKELVSRIKNLEETYSEHLNYWDKQEMQKEIDEILYLVDELLPDEKIPVIQPMNDVEFNLLKRNVTEASFADNKKQIVTASAVNHFFVVIQLIELLNIFPFDDNKLEIIQVVYPKILDPGNKYLLYNCLIFSSSKEKLDKIIQDIKMKSRDR